MSLSGDWLTIGALVGWVYSETGSTGHVAAILLVRLTPPILGAGVAAFVVDRLPKRGLLIVIEVGRCVAVLGALGGVIAGSRPAVYVAFGLSGAFTALSEALVPSLVPSLVPRSDYAAANALLGMTENVAMVLGSLGAGLAISFVGIEPALAIDALTFGVAAALFALVGPLRYATPRSADGTDSGSPLMGLRYLFSRRTLFFLVASFAAATMATGLANATLPRFLSEQLGLGNGAYGFGFAALATGLALGKASVGLTRVGSHGGRWIGCALVLMASVFCLLGADRARPDRAGLPRPDRLRRRDDGRRLRHDRPERGRSAVLRLRLRPFLGRLHGDDDGRRRPGAGNERRARGAGGHHRRLGFPGRRRRIGVLRHPDAGSRRPRRVAGRRSPLHLGDRALEA